MAAEDENIDYIAFEHQLMLENHGFYTFLVGEDRLDLFRTFDLVDTSVHPIVERPLEIEEIAYIAFHLDCYEKTRELIITQETLNKFIGWYLQSRKEGKQVADLRTNPETEQAYSIVRFYMIPTDFQSHFRDFNSQDSKQEAYERDLSEKALHQRGSIGSWLLRHSSLNRPATLEDRNRLKRLGIRYYAVSFITPTFQIEHRLIAYHIGRGFLFQKQWFTNFLDTLEFILVFLNLSFGRWISDYVHIDTSMIQLPSSTSLPTI